MAQSGDPSIDRGRNGITSGVRLCLCLLVCRNSRDRPSNVGLQALGRRPEEERSAEADYRPLHCRTGSYGGKGWGPLARVTILLVHV